MKEKVDISKYIKEKCEKGWTKELLLSFLGTTFSIVLTFGTAQYFEAQKQQAILEAEGVATARIRVAEAEAVAIKKITEAVGDCTNPANYLLAQKYIQMMEELAKGDKTKTVYLPYEATNVMGSLGGIKELFKGQ